VWGGVGDRAVHVADEADLECVISVATSWLGRCGVVVDACMLVSKLVLKVTGGAIATADFCSCPPSCRKKRQTWLASCLWV